MCAGFVRVRLPRRRAVSIHWLVLRARGSDMSDSYHGYMIERRVRLTANKRSSRPLPPRAPPSTPRLFGWRLGRDQLLNIGQELVDGPGSLIAVLPVAHGNLSALLFAIPHHQHERDFLQLSVADLEVDL